ncbi:alkanesulfonate monooxygenase SsuD/methylene tetrahydromethanopterin reductase-like flavin-dependent oxidoreductase (luciferase family) [Nocardia transvalensis]|uniref:Alkanesulfonate monooxygenase SsuD/methylene tetrahydromethanopterin reductase-like flavin-dependent oxidoreductase (Luciferase family) n=1 Tax=Nocardia transvalensis TaxID=37333 RepID=A0A7W9PI24_9NOCA|nr:LLM class flavin-dependent oxidoreductase [Nocardia transvalensis]MBB5916567.1 alkanesulfonate monooxygenase SsuD/methylene tetrahydromethanopterin reductase-like flavin-dependent oxidoreductase (luciferase family) [Nocardia transvalensis]
MKFLASTLVPKHSTGLAREALSRRERFRELVDLALWAEGVGYDAFGVGERHNPALLSSSPAVILAHIAARTRRIRLVTTVAVLSLTDPVRAAEDYATLDNLSDGRLDLIIGKGGDRVAPTVFQVPESELWDRLEESYELVRRLWREDGVSWQGRFRPPLSGATIEPRPLQQPAPRVWHGSATSRRSTELAARWGDPLYSANGLDRTDAYVDLVRHYRERLAHHGHDADAALVAVGVHSPIITDRSQDALAVARPLFEASVREHFPDRSRFPFDSLEDFVENGSALVGTADQIIEKLLRTQARFGNQVFGIGVEGFFSTYTTDLATTKGYLERFFGEVAPVLRAEVPTTLWDPRPGDRGLPITA